MPRLTAHQAKGAARRLKQWLPAPVFEALKSVFGTVRYSGDYSCWSDAARACEGYASEGILERVVAASLAVERGEAAFERDAALFDHVEYSWPLLASLLWIATLKTRLHVVDVGGSLGSSYRQNRAFLGSIADVRWSIVEQPAFVDRGRALFESDIMRFYVSTAECFAHETPDVALLSSVLPYLESPYTLIEDLVARRLEFILVDRTFFTDERSDRLRVQHVSGSLVRSSYPAWFFSRDKFLRTMHEHYRVVADFDSLDRTMGAQSQGFLFRRRGDASGFAPSAEGSHR